MRAVLPLVDCGEPCTAARRALQHDGDSGRPSGRSAYGESSGLGRLCRGTVALGSHDEFAMRSGTRTCQSTHPPESPPVARSQSDPDLSALIALCLLLKPFSPSPLEAPLADQPLSDGH